MFLKSLLAVKDLVFILSQEIHFMVDDEVKVLVFCSTNKDEMESTFCVSSVSILYNWIEAHDFR